MPENNTKESLKCPICNGNKIKKLYDKFPGYVDKTYFDIYKCDECKTQFIIAPDTPEEVYNAIYSLDCIPGYDRYKRLCSRDSETDKTSQLSFQSGISI